jgi:hypothetical protein
MFGILEYPYKALKCIHRNIKMMLQASQVQEDKLTVPTGELMGVDVWCLVGVTGAHMKGGELLSRLPVEPDGLLLAMKVLVSAGGSPLFGPPLGSECLFLFPGRSFRLYLR